MVYFTVGNNAVMAASNYLTLDLPWAWTALTADLQDGSWTGSATLTKDVWDTAVVPATNTPATIAVTCSMVGAGTIMVTPDNDSDGNAVTLANNANYTLTVSGVATPD